jgi:MarR family transcriptional regulator, organic hydroperoxide resistance regulator
MKPGRSSLQRELRQRRPFHSRRVESVIAVLRTADLLRRRLSQASAPHGITYQQYNVLRILRGAGEDGLPTLAIGERMVEQTPGVTRLVDRLVAKGLAARGHAESDGRLVLCRLTAEGRGLLARLDPEMEAAAEACVAMLRAKEQTSLLDLLAAIREGSQGGSS